MRSLRATIISVIGAFASALVNVSPVPKGTKIVFVTAADSSHFLSLKQLLGSLFRSHPLADVYVWDLGLMQEEFDDVKAMFPIIKLYQFPFDDYPSYFRMERGAGEYAWKPVIVRKTWEILQQEGDAFRFLIWTDAGNVFFRKLTWSLGFIRRHGVHSPFSTGDVRMWTHPSTIQYFGLSEEDLRKRNANGAFVGFDLSSREATDLISEWSEAALEREIIAPEGSSRSNHRQDQAVLTCLITKKKLLADSKYRNNWFGEFRTNCDVEKGNGIGDRWTASGRRIAGG